MGNHCRERRKTALIVLQLSGLSEPAWFGPDAAAAGWMDKWNIVSNLID